MLNYVSSLYLKARKFFAPTIYKLPEEVASKFIAKVEKDNLLKSLDDDRDFIFVPTVDVTNVVRSNNRVHSSKVEDQLTLGSCTGNATTSACESIENQGHGYIHGVTDLSRMFAYQMAQKLDNLEGDVGATIRSALKGAKNFGLPRETDYPYNLNQYGTEPSDAVKALAAQRKLLRFERIEINRDNLPDTHMKIQSALAEGLRLVVGFDVQRWMMYITGPMNTHHNQPGPLSNGDPMLDYVGKHAIFLEDYDRQLNPSAGGSYICVNSWGTSYGDGGRWAFPKATFLNYAFEIWAVRGFNDVIVGGTLPAVPLTAAQIADGRAWLISRGLGHFDANGQFVYNGAAYVANYVAAGAARRVGYTPEQYAGIIGLPGPDVRAFMDAPVNQALINAYAS